MWLLQVMLLVNLSLGSPYLCNGSRGVCVDFVDARWERAQLEQHIEVLSATLAALQVRAGWVGAFGAVCVCRRRRLLADPPAQLCGQERLALNCAQRELATCGAAAWC